METREGEGDRLGFVMAVFPGVRVIAERFSEGGVMAGRERVTCDKINQQNILESLAEPPRTSKIMEIVIPKNADVVRKLKNGREWTERLIIPLFWGHKCRQGVEPYVKKGVLRVHQTLFTGSIMYNIKTPSSTIRGILGEKYPAVLEIKYSRESAGEAGWACAGATVGAVGACTGNARYIMVAGGCSIARSSTAGTVRAARGQYGPRADTGSMRTVRHAGTGGRNIGRWHGDGVRAYTWYGGNRTQCHRAERPEAGWKLGQLASREDWRECGEGYRPWEAKRRPAEDGTGRKERLFKAQEARNNGRAGERERGGGSEKGREYNKGKQNSSFGRVDGFPDATSSGGRARTTRRMPTSGAARVRAGARADERGYSADDISFALGHWRPRYISDSGTSPTS
ncbi:hypothetical protein B0H17DRAFT_1277350 [Mycena rosella]|uniref:Uncharacterized protein n=1 Tax=Mycena rosella TaxID=1033263 RepID=A0AAD7DMQ1_MYCRO|nr:hypothetical protein B0H17DRAFT_1277350 [Mycena rosella]